VDLYVVADRQAATAGFETVAADRYVLEPSESPDEGPLYAGGSTTLRIGQPDLMALMWDGCILTRLSAELTSDQMDHDILLDLVRLRPKRLAYHSDSGRRDLVAAVGWAGLMALLVVAAMIGIGATSLRRWHIVAVAGTGLSFVLLAVVTYALTDTRPTTLGDGFTIIRHTSAMRGLIDPYDRDGNPVAITEEMIEDALARRFGEHVGNPLTGGPIRRECSPGNYDLRQIGGQTYYCAYDEYACEHYVPERPEPMSKE